MDPSYLAALIIQDTNKHPVNDIHEISTALDLYRASIDNVLLHLCEHFTYNGLVPVPWGPYNWGSTEIMYLFLEVFVPECMCGNHANIRRCLFFSHATIIMTPSPLKGAFLKREEKWVVPIKWKIRTSKNNCIYNYHCNIGRMLKISYRTQRASELIAVYITISLAATSVGWWKSATAHRHSTCSMEFATMQMIIMVHVLEENVSQFYTSICIIFKML